MSEKNEQGLVTELVDASDAGKTGCKHVNTANRDAALRDGGRYYDVVLGQWTCPWCSDWSAAVAEAEGLREREDAVHEALPVIAKAEGR